MGVLGEPQRFLVTRCNVYYYSVIALSSSMACLIVGRFKKITYFVIQRNQFIAHRRVLLSRVGG